MPDNPWLLALVTLVAGFAVAGILVLRFKLFAWLDRSRVTRLFERRGADILEVHYDAPCDTGMYLADRTATFWRIRYRDSNGQERVATCAATFLRCKIMKDEPA